MLSIKRLIRIVYPKRCSNCGEIIPIEKDVCPCSAEKVVLLDDDACTRCGYSRDRCDCKRHKTQLRHITAPFIYTGSIRARLLDFKYKGKVKEADFFAMKMSERFARIFPQVKIDAVTFVPMTENDENTRGFNQSKLLAKNISANLMVPFVCAIEKVRQTPGQHILSQEQRQTNLLGAFITAKDINIQGKTILLCDDIKTTGATLIECCGVLMSAGAKDVYCLCAAVSDYVADIDFSV